MMRNKKGQVVLYLSFLIAAIIIIMITAVFAPLGVRFNTEVYAAGEKILEQTNFSASQINNTNVSNRVQAMLDSSFEAAETNIEVNNSLFKYSWIFVVAIAAALTFIAARRIVEFGAGGFV